jgi:hypothetical protein
MSSKAIKTNFFGGITITEIKRESPTLSVLKKKPLDLSIEVKPYSLKWFTTAQLSKKFFSEGYRGHTALIIVIIISIAIMLLIIMNILV